MNNEHKYGVATVGYGTPDQKEIPLKNFMRFKFKDQRLISISEFGEGYGMVVANPESTGRTPQTNMYLSKESFLGLISAAMIYMHSVGIDLQDELKNFTDGDNVQFEFSDNLMPPFSI